MILQVRWWYMRSAAGLLCPPLFSLVHAAIVTAKTVPYLLIRHQAFLFWRLAPGFYVLAGSALMS